MDIYNILKNNAIELKEVGSTTPEIDSSALLEYVMNNNREYLVANSNQSLTNTEYLRFRRLIRRRKKGEPIAHITKHKEFYGYDFFVNKNVLIPRPESEMLVEIAMQFLESRALPAGRQELRKEQTRSTPHDQPLTVLDLGTGSGCLIITLVKEINKLVIRPTPYALRYFASDISKKALYVARKNAKLHGINKQIRFFNSDLFSNQRIPKKYDLIIANLPYVAEGHLEQSEGSYGLLNSKWKNPILYEPNNSIFAEDNGTKIIKAFVDQVKDRINNSGVVLIEADPRNIENISIYAKKHIEKSKTEIIKDLAGKKRVLKLLT